MKKRIFIALHYMEIGGVETSMIGLLNAIDYSKYDVDLMIYSHQGELMPLIPSAVNLLPENKKYASLEKPMKSVLKQGYIDIVVARLIARFQFQKYAKKNQLTDNAAIFQYIANRTTPLLPDFHHLGEYDLAISFLTPHNIVRDKVKAKKKIAWIHTDYTYINVNAELELPVWSSYDYIASISEDVSRTFCQVFPTLENKLVLIRNILSADFVRQRAIEKADLSDFPRKEGVARLLSVGRFSAQKNFDNVPAIAKRLLELGVSFQWYLIGYGDEENLIRTKIQELQMEEHVIILGKKSNPYPYMAVCDFYIQPSRYEGNSVTVREAQMLMKPVVVTNYSTAPSQIKNRLDGIIVPMDNDLCAEGIANFINDEAQQEQILSHLQQNNYGNESEALKIDLLLE